MIESPLNKTTSVAFKLTNRSKTFAPFNAYFKSESDSEFLVSPKTGMLEPFGKY